MVMVCVQKNTLVQLLHKRSQLVPSKYRLYGTFDIVIGRMNLFPNIFIYIPEKCFKELFIVAITKVIHFFTE